MNIGKAKRFLVFFLSIVMMVTMAPTSVFASGSGSASAGGKATSSGQGPTGAHVSKTGMAYVYFDRGGFQNSDYGDNTEASAQDAPKQGWYSGKTGKWHKSSVGNKENAWKFYIGTGGQLTKKIDAQAKLSGRFDHTLKYREGWLDSRSYEWWEDQFTKAAKRAIKDGGNPKTNARVVGVATTYQVVATPYHAGWGVFRSTKNKTFTNMFKKPMSDASHNSDLKPQKAWESIVEPNDSNSAKYKVVNGEKVGTETWEEYVYRKAKSDNKDSTYPAGVKTKGWRVIILAVTDDQPPMHHPEFATKMIDLNGNPNDNVKVDLTNPGDVKVKDGILYKNLDKTTYTVSADLRMSDDVSLVPVELGEDQVEDLNDDNIDLTDDEPDEFPQEGLTSEDGLITIGPDYVSIDKSVESFNTYTGGNFYCVISAADESGQYTNVLATLPFEEQQAVDTEDDEGNPLTFKDVLMSGFEINGTDKALVSVYYAENEAAIASSQPIYSGVVDSTESSGSETAGEDTEIDNSDMVEDPSASDLNTSGKVIASVVKATPSPAFKTGSGQTNWQPENPNEEIPAIELKGNHNGHLDLYKEGLFNSVAKFDTVYKAGIQATVYDGTKVQDTLNEDLSDGNEATEIPNVFGTLTFDKQAVYNHKNASVVETGATFNVYSKEYASYDAAVADAQSKGYETYKYDQIVISDSLVRHGDDNLGFNDYIQWKLHNGMFVPGTYVVEETSAGDFAKSNRLIDKFEVNVELGKVANAGEKKNPHYTYELTVEKRSTNFWRPGWEPQTEDPLFSKQTQFVLESLDDEKNVMGNGDGKLPTAKNSDGSLVSSSGYSNTKNTDPWTIVIDNLPSGRYRITEDAPIGYWLPKDKASVEFKVYRDMNGKVEIDDLKGHDAAFTTIDTRKDETTDKTSYKVTFTRSNVHQKTWLKLHKDRDSQNSLGNTESEGFPYVEFNLYSVGDIRSYDGHDNHVYYKDGQLIRGIQIDEETGERHYFNDGKEVSEETFRIMTNPQGDWDSGKVWVPADNQLKGEALKEGGQDAPAAWKWYPLTNNNLIDTYNSDGTPTGNKDGVSKYKFQEMYIWEFGDHISFTDDEKAFLADQWTKNYTKEGTDYGSMDAKIGDIGLSMNQILNHGIDITENQDENGGRTGSKTYTYSSFGKELHDDVVEDFFNEKVLKFVDPANGADDTTATIKNRNEIAVGEIEYNLLVLWPDQKTEFPKIDETNSEFQVLPDNIDTTEVVDSALQMFTNEDGPILKTVAEVNETGTHKYTSDADVVTIHDTVSYHNLIVGREYEMIGTLYNYDTAPDGSCVLGEPILDENGDPLTVTEKFIPTNKKDKLEMVFHVTPKQLNYDNVVVFERCKLGDDLIVEEADPSIETQQLTTDANILIETQATYNGKHIMPNDSDVTFIDTVEYWGLTPGTEYVLKGALMERDGSENGVPVQVDGKDVTAEYKFTANAKHGKVDVPFNVNTSDLDGKTVVVFEELYAGDGSKIKNPVTGDDMTIEHKDINDENQTIIIPSVETNASDEATQEHVGEKNKKATVIDVVKYTNLIPGEKYTISGKLMKKPKADDKIAVVDENNKAESQIDDKDAQVKDEDGNVVQEGTPMTGEYEVLAEASKSFTAEEANGSLELKFTVDSEKLHGYSAVAFETITDDETGVEIAIHRDINDPDQTVDYPEIKTTALDGNIKLHVGEFGTKVSIIDTVTYENLTPGLEYEMSGTLMDKATGDPLKIDGKPVRASEKFTPEAANGSVDLLFELDSTKLGGTSVVAFEELTFNDVLVAEHKNIEDPEQTVDYPEIKTIAVDAKTKTHEGLASADAQIIDTVQYKNLTPGVEYIVRGVLMDKETGDVYIAGKGDTAGVANSTAKTASDAAAAIAGAVKEPEAEAQKEAPQTDVAPKTDEPKTDQPKADEPKAEGEGEAVTPAVDEQKDDAQKEDADTAKTDGAKEEAAAPAEVKKDVAVSATPTPGAVWAEVKFTPTEKDGEVEIPFDIKNGDVAGKKLVAFESIYVLNENGEEVEVGRHEDITDPDQTVGYPEIRTNAVDAESGEHVGLVRDSITVKDKVTYKGLTPGQTYTVVGTLMDKETGKPIVAGADAKKMKDKAAGEKTDGSSTTSTVAADAAKNLKPVGTAEALGKTTNVYNWGALANYLKATGYTTYDLFVADADKVTSEAVGKTFMNSGLAGIFLGANESLKIQMSTGEQLPIFTDYIEPGQEGSFYGIQFVPGIDGANENAYGLATIHVKNNGSEKAQMGECEITSIDRHLEATEKTTEEKASETKETTPAEKAAEGAQTSGAVTAQKTFTAENSEGSVEIEFTFTGVDMSNRAAVAFEKLYAGGKVDDNMIVATHEDLNDADQTVFYPTIDTKASYKDGVITDTVTYTNLIPGLEYELTGTLMDKKSGNSMEISAMTKFTPKEANGTVDMKFEVDKDKVAGKSIVVFETLKLNDKVVAEHHDINDKDQTVTIDKKNPSKETKESKDAKKDSTDRASYKTGDFLPYILMAVLAMILASIYVVQRRRRREEE